MEGLAKQITGIRFAGIFLEKVFFIAQCALSNIIVVDTILNIIRVVDAFAFAKYFAINASFAFIRGLFVKRAKVNLCVLFTRVEVGDAHPISGKTLLTIGGVFM